MFARMSALWYMIRHVGSARGLLDQVRAWTRFCVIDGLRKTGFFDYLTEPHDFREICSFFGIRDEAFATDILVTLVNDEEGILLYEDGKYRLNPACPLPTREEIERSLSPMVRGLHFFEDLGEMMMARMTGESMHMVRRMEQERGQMASFDATLKNSMYDTARVCAVRWTRPYLKDLDGKKLLIVGCGSGREAAHIWIQLNGKIKITAIDPVPSFVALSQERFTDLIHELNTGRKPPPPITEANTPEFRVMEAGKLDFPDAHFDLVFHSVMLHWTPNPQKAIAEMLRVLKPGGVIFGVAAHRPVVSAYDHLVLRANDNVYGYPWYDDVVRWHHENHAEFEHLIGGIYRAKKKA